MEINEFLQNVQGSDELKSTFISEFTKTDFGKDFLNKYKQNNTPKLFDTDENGRIVNNEKLDPRIGELIGHERKKLHSERDKLIAEITGIQPQEGEEKGFAKRALENWLENNRKKGDTSTEERLKELKNLHVQDLERVRDESGKSIKDWEQKYNDLQNQYQSETKKNIIASATIGMDFGDLDIVGKKFIESTLKEIEGMISIEEGKAVIKNEDGTIKRKPNQDAYTVEDLVKESLAPLLERQPAKNGGGSKSYVGSNGIISYQQIVDSSSSRGEVQQKISDILQKKGLAKGDAEYRKQLTAELINLRKSTNYDALPT